MITIRRNGRFSAVAPVTPANNASTHAKPTLLHPEKE
jgi:hypothetical protein